MDYSIQESEQMRRESIFPSLENGFKHILSGRSGFLYYKSENRMLELYTEISGVPEYHFLIWEDGLEYWVYPNREPVSAKDQNRISEELLSWLKGQGHKTDFNE